MRELFKHLESSRDCEHDGIIERWLEQNHLTSQEVKVVGLSDYQIRELAIELEFETTDNCERDEFEVIIKNWLKTQTFAQPNESLIADNLTLAKELEQLKANSDDEGDKDSYKEKYHWIYDAYSKAMYEIEQLKSKQQKPDWLNAPEWANWLAQDSCGRWHWFENKPTEKSNSFQTNSSLRICFGSIKNWQQTLEQRPNKIHKEVEFGDVRTGSSAEYQPLEALSQEQKQFEFSWDDAPKRADEVSVSVNWHKDGVLLESKELFSEQRPKPTPQVEVGQVWKHSNDCNYQIDSLGETKFNDNAGWIDCVTYRSLETGRFYTRPLEDFLVKFEKVKS